ncbi:hypothetical protein Zm00014a_009613 [Zea mays]|jgi:hypothetical protein|uniref:Uncharacterized protein n=2 Tax=Zea mays TaxID=4577 RepID=K7U761_MAIZE|nr:uncharacterized protein LOC100275060 [Zea mays]AQK54186.1 hypothetical protein ZEAMMB73_Zm00001d051411 [Zea mays]PWZ26688.1 hypothetical protein Zm00014a_009613 [Zea mays]|eukprot:XP_020406983.1 uncharacterized protein LOC100275060 isoform X1 [Zea mays]
MELEAAAAPATCRRDGRRLVRCPRLQLDTETATAIERSTGESVAAEGAMRVKIVLSKQQLKQVAAAVAAAGSGGAFAGLPPALEQLVSVLKRRQHARKQQAAAADAVAAAGRRRGRWSPALQCIPEECF